MKKAFTVSQEPKDLFSGRFFSGFPKPQLCDKKGQNCQANLPMVLEVAFTRTDAQHPGLRVDFRSQKVLYLSRARAPTTFDNFVTVRTGSFEFDKIDYVVADRFLTAKLANLDIVAERGNIRAKDIDLALDPGSRLAFTFVDFTRSKSGESELDAESGTLTGAVGGGSRLNLTTGIVNASDLVFDTGSEVNLQRFVFHIDDSRSTTIRIGGGSTVKVNVRGGRLGFGRDGFVALRSGLIESKLSGDWNSAERPDSTLQISNLDIQLAGGQIDLNSNAHIILTGGRIKSDNLNFSGLVFAGLTGDLLDVSFQIGADSRFGIPAGFRITTDAGGSLIAATPGQPLKLVSMGAYPVGTFALSLPFKRMVNSNAASFALMDGRADLTVVNAANGDVTGDGQLHGDLILESGLGSLKALLEVTNVKFQKPAQGQATLTANTKATFQPGLQFAIRTPFVKRYRDEQGDWHEDFRAFPINIRATVTQIGATNVGTLTFTANAVNMSALTLSPRFSIELPPGDGEHQDKNDENSANGQHPGRDDLKRAQEAAYDEFTVCHAHVYVFKGVYDADSNLSMSITNNQLDISISQFNPTTQIAFDKDGCDLPFIVTLISSFVGFVVFGGAGAVVAGIVGYKVGNTLDQKVNNRIAAAIADKIHSFHKDWHIHI